jgi:hypothetical protein
LKRVTVARRKGLDRSVLPKMAKRAKPYSPSLIVSSVLPSVCLREMASKASR